VLTGSLVAVRHAVAIVCDVEPETLTAATRFDEIGADSLSRVGIADVLESSSTTRSGGPLRLDDAVLGRMTTLAELAEHLDR
jgi:Phosphopantetheine attachment site